jgi:hypothetical protein
MRSEYQEIVRNVCHLPDWHEAPLDEQQGAIAVACLLAYLRGTSDTTEDMAEDIGVPENEIEAPLRRMQVNGVFSTRQSIENDPVLAGNGDDQTVFHDDGKFWFDFTASQQAQNAWCWVAGIGSGFCGLRETDYVKN